MPWPAKWKLTEEVTLDLNPSEPGHVQSVVLQREAECHQARFASVGRDAYETLEAGRREILHVNELAYFDPLPSESRRVSFLLGRYAAKLALRVHLGSPKLSEIDIVPGVFKNPVVCFPMEYPWQVSITHMDTMAGAIAFPMVHPMGLDVEKIDAARTSVMASQCREAEIREVEKTGLKLDAACALLWTAKEAVSKALGTGLMCPFELLEVQSIARMGPGQYQGSFRALAQYGFRSWIQGRRVLSIALPKKTEMSFARGSPWLAETE